MNYEAGTLLISVILLGVRMMPIFICLDAHYAKKETIAAISVYLWAIMVFIQSLAHIPGKYLSVMQGLFSLLFFLVLLIFFDGRLLKKAFLYISAWLFSILFVSLSLLVGWILRGTSFSLVHIRLIVIACLAVWYYFFVRHFLSDPIDAIFRRISWRQSVLLLSVPTLFLLLLYIGTNSIFSADTIMSKDLKEMVFFLSLCLSFASLYLILVFNTYSTLQMHQTQIKLESASSLIAKQKEHYDRLLHYLEEIRIIKHDFRHHIHAIIHMSKEEQTSYLHRLDSEMNMITDLFFCENAAVNSLLQDYMAKTKKCGIALHVKVDIPRVMPIDDLTLCVIIGNLLENAFEACRKVPDSPAISISMKWNEDHLLILVENPYCGQLKKSGTYYASTKRSGGLGLVSIQRLLHMPGDDFDVCATPDRFAAMVKIMDRTTEDGI